MTKRVKEVPIPLMDGGGTAVVSEDRVLGVFEEIYWPEKAQQIGAVSYLVYRLRDASASYFPSSQALIDFLTKSLG